MSFFLTLHFIKAMAFVKNIHLKTLENVQMQRIRKTDKQDCTVVFTGITEV